MATCCWLASFVQAIGTDQQNANEPASVACVDLCLFLFMLENSAFMVRLRWCAMSTTTELLVGSCVTNLQNNYISCFSAICALVKGIWPFHAHFITSMCISIVLEISERHQIKLLHFLIW